MQAQVFLFHVAHTNAGVHKARLCRVHLYTKSSRYKQVGRGAGWLAGWLALHQHGCLPRACVP